MKPGAKWVLKHKLGMAEKGTIYTGGELDDHDRLMPKDFSKFFTRSYLLIVLLLLALLFLFIFRLWGEVQP